ncbi:hypothetical protein A4D02_34630 [Niastella koreensis]|uniref:Uncharacterized protein n=2 Tax=Niastella koreensis TaxID=354356 RepID=G8TRR9_NIAKG|nr:hypothetical protein [Niastella koreensis]AEW02216.1 hypothetical protein Niako_5987 [Niastella koreensis GR20-10]OQP45089.1 hypothetical protein A4D02_34630 [Niastella koreensis]
MQGLVTFLKSFLTIFLLFIASFVVGQEAKKGKLSVLIQRKSNTQTALPYSDTLKIQLDGGFINDVLKIKSGNNYFTTDTLRSDKLLGHAATLKIPKVKGRQRLTIYLSEVYIGKLTLKKGFSEAHINYFDNEFEWTYIDYLFFYL